MPLTLAIIAGFSVLLPGLGALAFWNLRLARGAVRRPELRLTSTTALFLVLFGSGAFHIIGFGVTSLCWSAAVEIGGLLPPHLQQPLWPQPFEVGLSLIERPAHAHLTIAGVGGIVVVLALETALAVELAASPAIDLLLDGIDVSGQGWTYRAVTRPVQFGYTPFAYVLTNPTQGELGLGYQGVVADIRQGQDGELKFISLAEPESFSYTLRSVSGEDAVGGGLLNGERRALGGILVIEGGAIRNILIHAVGDRTLGDLETDAQTREGGMGETPPV